MDGLTELQLADSKIDGRKITMNTMAAFPKNRREIQVGGGPEAEQ